MNANARYNLRSIFPKGRVPSAKELSLLREMTCAVDARLVKYGGPTNIVTTPENRGRKLDRDDHRRSASRGVSWSNRSRGRSSSPGTGTIGRPLVETLQLIYERMLNDLEHVNREALDATLQVLNEVMSSLEPIVAQHEKVSTF
jgi:hypothetical protein